MLNEEDESVPSGSFEPTPTTSPAGQTSQADPSREFGFRSSTPRFLLVEVPRGASRADLVKAVDHALSVPEVPFFKNTTPTATDPTQIQAQAVVSGGASGDPASGTTDPTDPTGGSSNSSGGWSGLDPHAGLLLFVKQEGFP